MSSSLLITLEMSGVLGVVLAFGFWELWSLRREKARDKAREAAQASEAASAGTHASAEPAEK